MASKFESSETLSSSHSLSKIIAVVKRKQPLVGPTTLGRAELQIRRSTELFVAVGGAGRDRSRDAEV